MGDFSYDANQNILGLNSFDATLTLCDFQLHNEFKNDYFGYFLPGINYTYEVYTHTATNKSYLTLSPTPGFDLVYQDFPLGVSENVAEKQQSCFN